MQYTVYVSDYDTAVVIIKVAVKYNLVPVFFSFLKEGRIFLVLYHTANEIFPLLPNDSLDLFR